jgi:TRAP transporter TAXI family solute receptor
MQAQMRPILALIAVLTLAQPLFAQNLRLFSVGSGDLDGGYFAAARAICEVINRAERRQLRCSPESTAGSLYNLVALDKGQLDFAIVQSDWQKHAFKGTSVFASRGPMTQLRSVMSLYAEPFSLLARRKSGVESFRDLIGKRVDIGPPSSGRQATMRAVIESFGIQISDFQFVTELPSSDAISELCAGRIDATALIVGHPNTAITRALDECDAVLISLGGGEIERLISANDEYGLVTLPARTNGTERGEVVTFAVRATVVTLASTDDEIVDAFARNSLANLAALRRKVPVLSTLELGAMQTTGLSAPLHPAAARAFDKLLAAK